MEFRVLGRLEVDRDGRMLAPSRRRERCLLGVLLRAIVGECVVSADGGYRIDTDWDLVDAHRFRTLVDRAHDLAEPAARADLLRCAIALWRGPILAGDTSPRLRERAGAALNQLKVTATELMADAELTAGRHREVIGELVALTTEHPHHERFAAQLMIAQYRSGQRADALDTYRRARLRLADDLGVDPGPNLRQLRAAILRGDHPAHLRQGQGVPAQLPADLPSFTGRSSELAELDRIVYASGPVAVLSGSGGIGKTTLAVHWAHRVAGRFPDGQLYVDLRGFDPGGPAMSPAEAAHGFLAALGVAPQRIPTELDAQITLYRDLLARRRMLIVLDNAKDTDQVRPLLPDASGCVVVLTSRGQLDGLGTTRLTLDLLSPAEARQLLTGRLGAARLAAEPDAVEEIIARSARLPLALAVVAAKAAGNTRFPLARIATALHAARDSLRAFDTGDPATDVRAVFSWSYQALGAESARLFRLLGLHPGQDIGAAAVASLAGVEPAAVPPLVAELTGANLIAEPVAGRYACHELLRAYATELVHREDSQSERRTAMLRVLDHYLHTGHAADKLFEPFRDPLAIPPPAPGVTPEPLADDAQALAWFSAERAVLVATVSRAATEGFDDHVGLIAWTLCELFNRCGHWHDLATTQRLAIESARRRADRVRLGDAHRMLGFAYARLGRSDAALAELRDALTEYGELGDRVRLAKTHLVFGWLLDRLGQPEKVLDHALRALESFRAAGNRLGEARTLNSVGWSYAVLGRYAEASDHCRQALEALRETGDRRSLANVWDSLGYIHFQLGEHPRAVAAYTEALALQRAVADRYYQADVLIHLADAHDAMGDRDSARDALRQALVILDELDHADAIRVQTKLAELADRTAHGPGPGDERDRSVRSGW